MPGMAHRALPLPVTEREAIIMPAANMTCPRRCEEPVRNYQRLPVPEALVLYLPPDFIERRILYVFRKLSITHHSGYVQILDDYDIRLAVADDALAHLVDCILPDVGDPLMKQCYFMSELLPVAGPLPLFRKELLLVL